MDKPPSKSHWSAIGAALGALSGAVTLISNLVGAIQLGHESLGVILLVSAATTIFLCTYALSKKQNRSGFWAGVTAMALALAIVMVIVAFGAIVMTPQGSPSVAPTVTGQPSNTPPVKQSSTPVQPSSQPVHQGAVRLQLNQGINVDTQATPIDATVIDGDLDLVLINYFTVISLNASGDGLYAVEGTPQNPEQTCRDTIDRHLVAPQKNPGALEGTQYCMRTSQGNLAWVVIRSSNALDYSVPDAEKAATLAVSVWQH